MKLIEVQLENFRCIKNITWQLNDSLNVLVGENDAGKTAIVDAIHLALGSVAQEQTAYVAEFDFHNEAKELRVTCKFSFSDNDSLLAGFIEYLTYEEIERKSSTGQVISKEKLPFLYLSMESERTDNDRWPINTKFLCGKPVEVEDKNKKSGHNSKKANGTQFELEVRRQLNITYLRPLRDADHELVARRGSRLSALLNRLVTLDTSKQKELQDALDKLQKSIKQVFGDYTKRGENADEHGKILKKLIDLLFQHEVEYTNIDLDMHPKGSQERQIKSLLERLDLAYAGERRGLGSSNLLFIALELTLLENGFNFLIIEEPEAHLHPQRQLKLANSMQELSKNGAQIILTTHSPNLASKFNIDSLTIVKEGDVFPLKDTTNLSKEDKDFLKRFLDVTKANLFFARGLLLVEGESEELLLPTIARLLGKDLTDNGISIVKVGSKAALRYAKVFQRNDGKKLGIPVAILTDRDELSQEMKEIMMSIHDGYGKKDAGPLDKDKLDTEEIKTCISNYWTFEYDLALGDGNGNDLACEILQAMYWLDDPDRDNSDKTKRRYVQQGLALYDEIRNQYKDDHVSMACQIMYIFEHVGTKKYKFDLKRKRKPEMAQALATILEENKPPKDALAQKLPSYLLDSINHVTPSPKQEQTTGE